MWSMVETIFTFLTVPLAHCSNATSELPANFNIQVLRIKQKAHVKLNFKFSTERFAFPVFRPPAAAGADTRFYFALFYICWDKYVGRISDPPT